MQGQQASRQIRASVIARTQEGVLWDLLCQPLPWDLLHAEEWKIPNTTGKSSTRSPTVGFVT